MTADIENMLEQAVERLIQDVKEPQVLISLFQAYVSKEDFVKKDVNQILYFLLIVCSALQRLQKRKEGKKVA